MNGKSLMGPKIAAFVTEAKRLGMMDRDPVAINKLSEWCKCKSSKIATCKAD
jgi:hypothetical protein